MFNEPFGRYICDGDTFETELAEGFTAVATIEHDDSGDKPDERCDGFWPSKDETAAGYVLPENFDAEQAKAEKVMKAWLNDEWHFVGVCVTIWKADVMLTQKYQHALWGIECNYPDSDNEYLRNVANELLPAALEDAKAKIAQLA